MKSFYLELTKIAGPNPSPILSKIWKGFVPLRIEIFSWLAIREKINTKQKLVSLNILLESEAHCLFCNSSMENASHLLLHCYFEKSLWNWWCELWNLSWVSPTSIELAFVQWSFPSRNKFFKKVWSAIFPIILWTIWKERNERVFMNKVSSSIEIRNLILLRLGWWIKGWKEPFPYSPEEVARSPSCLRWSEESIKKKYSLTNLKPQIVQSNGQPKLSWLVGVSINPYNSGLVMGGIPDLIKDRLSGAFSCPIPPMDSNSASILAIHRAIQITSNNAKFNILPIKVESDSIEAVKWSLNQIGGLGNMSFILRFIRSSLKEGAKIAISHKKNSSQMVEEMMTRMKLWHRSEFVAWM